MSTNFENIRRKYKNQIDNLSISNTNKTNYKNLINKTFNTKTMQNIVNQLEKRSLQNMRMMYKKKVNEMQYLTRTEQAKAKRKINALVNEQSMQNVVNNTTNNELQNILNEAKVSSNFPGTKSGKKILEVVWKSDKTLLSSLVVGLGVRGIEFTKIGNYKNPSVYLNNKTLAALKRYEQLFNKGAFARNVVWYSIVIFLFRFTFLMLERKTYKAKEYLKQIMDVRLSQYTVGGVSYFVLRQTAIKFVIVSLTAFLHGQIFMMKERALTPKPINKLNMIAASKLLNLSYTFWFAPKLSSVVPNTDEHVKRLINFLSTLLRGGTALKVIRGPSGALENVKNVFSGIGSSFKDRSLLTSGRSARNWILSPGRGSVSQPPRTRGDLLVLNNNGGKIYTFTNKNDIKNISTRQKYTNGGAQGANDIILKSNNGTRYRVTKSQYNKASTYEPGYNSPRKN